MNGKKKTMRAVIEIIIEQNRCAMACQGCDAVFLFLNKKAVETKS